MSYLILVESPSKCSKISYILNDNLNGVFHVTASVGHIKNLPVKKLGIDIKNKFEPDFEIISTKRKVVRNIQKLMKKAKYVYLACDNDREGERIAFDLSKILNLKEPKRIVFNEITKNAILNAFNNPTTINQNIVDAQTCRRVIDRLIGYKISPILKKYVNGNSSAGRVQSIVTKLVYEKEQEIKQFQYQSNIKVLAHFSKEVIGHLNKTFSSKNDLLTFLNDIQDKKFYIKDIKVKEEIQKPPPPYTTSSIQQDVTNKLKMPIKKSTMLLQQLYQKGIITYIRTDSTNISNSFLPLLTKHVEENYGPEYVQTRNFNKKVKNAQLAHECIRQTSLNNSELLSKSEKQIYDLIFKRTLASQMADAKINKYIYLVGIEGKQEHFTIEIEKVKFSGWKSLYNSNEKKLLSCKIGDEIKYEKIIGEEKFNKPPSHYSESTLIKKMEELGIGRPSTYAHAVSSIQDKMYCLKTNIKGPEKRTLMITMTPHHLIEKNIVSPIFNENQKLQITELGTKIVEYMDKFFNKIMDYNYTSKLEEALDEISVGKTKWQSVVEKYFNDFYPIVLDLTNTEKHAEIKEKYKPKSSKKVLGKYNNKDVLVYIGKYGPLVQLGTENPKFCSIPKNISLKEITLNQCIELLKYPKYIGDINHSPVHLHYGPYGYYVKWNNKNYSIGSLKPNQITTKICEEKIIK